MYGKEQSPHKNNYSNNRQNKQYKTQRKTFVVNRDLLLNSLQKYPNIRNPYVEALNNIENKSNFSAAAAMRKALEQMVKTLCGFCHMDSKELEKRNMFDLINLLYTNNIITYVSYNNYTKIRRWGNNNAHNDQDISSQDIVFYLRLLENELNFFVSKYAKNSYDDVVLVNVITRTDVFKDIGIRFFGAMFSIAGIHGFFVAWRNSFIINNIFYALLFLAGFFCLWHGNQTIQRLGGITTKQQTKRG